MMVINYPEPDFRLKKENKRELIFDSIRKRWVVLTPEEWVRQNFISYLIKSVNYPSALIAVEKELMLGERKKRFDILLYDMQHQPWMMIECKSMDVPLNDEVLQQLLRYHISIPARYLLITNGNNCFGWKKSNNQLESISSFPVLVK